MQALNVVFLSISAVLQLCIIFFLMRRGLQKKFRFFLAYSGYALLEAASRLSVVSNAHLYFKVYWIAAALGFVFAILAIWESFEGIFWLETKQAWFRWVFWSCVGVVVAYAVLRARFYPPRGATLLVATVIDLEIGRDYLFMALGVLYFGLVRFFKVIGHQRESTVIWGFGVSATLSLLGALIRSVFVTKFILVSALAPAIGYIVAELAWTRGFVRKEENEKIPEPEVSLDDLRFAMGYYTQLLYRYLGKEIKE